MHVYGDLFHIPVDSEEFPFPWVCRAPLGFETGTSVHIALVDGSSPAQDRLAFRLPDLVVSVLNPRYWHRTSVVNARCVDDIGLVHGVIADLRRANAVPFVNIVLGESATTTTEHRGGTHPLASRTHEIRFFCEHVQEDAPQRLADWSREWESKHRDHHGHIDIEPLLSPGSNPRPLGTAVLDYGLARLPLRWRQLQQDAARRLGREDEVVLFDLETVVATADLTSRSIRFIAPRVGASRVLSRHADQPNVAASLVGVIAENGHSIVAHHLRRRGPESAIFVAACEPARPGVAPLTEATFHELLKRESGNFTYVHVTEPVATETILHPRNSLRNIRRWLSHDMQNRRRGPGESRLKNSERELLRLLTRSWGRAKPAGVATENPDDIDVAQLMLEVSLRILSLGPLADIALKSSSFSSARGRPILTLSTGFDRIKDVGPRRQFHEFVRALVQHFAKGWQVLDLDTTDGDAILFAALSNASWALIVSPPVASSSPGQRSRSITIDYLFRVLNLSGSSLFLVEDGSAISVVSPERLRNDYGRSVRNYVWNVPSQAVESATGSNEHFSDGALFREIYEWLETRR